MPAPSVPTDRTEAKLLRNSMNLPPPTVLALSPFTLLTP